MENLIPPLGYRRRYAAKRESMNPTTKIEATSPHRGTNDYCVIAILFVNNAVARLPSFDIRIKGKQSRGLVKGILSDSPEPYILMAVEQTNLNDGLQVMADNRLNQPNTYYFRAELYLQNLASNDQLVIEHLNLASGVTKTDVISSIKVGIEKPDGTISELTGSPFDPQDQGKVTINL